MPAGLTGLQVRQHSRLVKLSRCCSQQTATPPHPSLQPQEAHVPGHYEQPYTFGHSLCHLLAPFTAHGVQLADFGMSPLQTHLRGHS